MITRDQLASGMLRECDICKHLFTKLTPAAYGYRPSPTQRTTLELLRYLVIIGIGGIRCMAENNWKLLGEHSARVKEMPADGFPAAMDRRKREIEAGDRPQARHRRFPDPSRGALCISPRPGRLPPAAGDGQLAERRAHGDSGARLGPPVQPGPRPGEPGIGAPTPELQHPVQSLDSTAHPSRQAGSYLGTVACDQSRRARPSRAMRPGAHDGTQCCSCM